MGVDFDPLTGEKFEDSAENEFFDYYNNFITPSMKLNDLAPGDDATPKPKRGPNPFSSWKEAVFKLKHGKSKSKCKNVTLIKNKKIGCYLYISN